MCPCGAAAAIWEAVEADLDLAICITEGIPVKDMLMVRNQMKAKEAAGGKNTAAGAQLPRLDYARRNQKSASCPATFTKRAHRRGQPFGHADL